MGYEFLDHTADVKFKAVGNSLEACFKSSFEALMKSIYGNIVVRDTTTHSFEVSGEDVLELLHNFLSEFLFLLDAKQFVSAKIVSLVIFENALSCVVAGDILANYSFTNEVKAVTYSEMKVERQKNEWISEVVLDV